MQSMREFDRQFPDDAACKAYLAEMRWPDGVRCPRCQASERVYALKARPFHWTCKNAECGGRNGYRFSVLTATIFQDTKIPLSLWFKVGYLMLTAKKGIPALQIHRVIFGEHSGSDYHTSWYMCHRWRAAMRGDMIKLSGVVEVDETFVGGDPKNRHGGKLPGWKSRKRGDRKAHYIGTRTSKTPVIGAIARKGNVVCQVLDRVTAQTMHRFVEQTVGENVSLVATDDHHGYRGLGALGFPHESVKHSRGEYVRGQVHTAHLDSFWSLLKRGVMGSFHKVSKTYLPLYMNEFSFRHNHRKHADAFGVVVAACGA